jgi:hypothetical protein
MADRANSPSVNSSSYRNEDLQRRSATENVRPPRARARDVPVRCRRVACVREECADLLVPGGFAVLATTPYRLDPLATAGPNPLGLRGSRRGSLLSVWCRSLRLLWRASLRWSRAAIPSARLRQLRSAIRSLIPSAQSRHQSGADVVENTAAAGGSETTHAGRGGFFKLTAGNIDGPGAFSRWVEMSSSPA